MINHLTGQVAGMQLEPFMSAGDGRGKGDSPGPAKFTGTGDAFRDWQHDYVRYAVGTGLDKKKWAANAAGFIHPKSGDCLSLCAHPA